MSGWLVQTLKWGGLALAVISAAALVYVRLQGSEGNDPASIAFFALIILGVACVFAGARWQRKFSGREEP